MSYRAVMRIVKFSIVFMSATLLDSVENVAKDTTWLGRGLDALCGVLIPLLLIWLGLLYVENAAELERKAREAQWKREAKLRPAEFEKDEDEDEDDGEGWKLNQ
jgi:hypothetical protein